MRRADMVEIACVAQTHDVLGEAPLWHPTDNALYWLDLFKPAIHRFDPATREVTSWTAPEKLGSFALRAAGGFLLAGRGGLSLYDVISGRIERIADPEDGDAANILNDGRCDRRGRFWVGSMNRLQDRAGGHLYRVEGRGVQTVADGIWLPNGICWSPDDRRMYLADSHLRTIFVCNFDLDDGTIGPRRRFAVMASDRGVPDGSSVDADGCLWSAVFDGGCLVRYAPDGRVDRVIRLPVTRPTACTFGGRDLATLYVTTGRFRLTPQQLAAEPHAGGVLAIDVGARGLPEPLFAS